jgi:hypothetical protein
MYTVEIYKKDKRVKTGERLYAKTDYDTDNLSMLEHTVKHTWRASQGFRYEIHETYVTRKNMMGGAEYQERYDTPRYCSPSSESYWSM